MGFWHDITPKETKVLTAFYAQHAPRFITRTAHEVAGDPDLYGCACRIGKSRNLWECTGYSRNGLNVRFARLVTGGERLRQVTIYVRPAQMVIVQQRAG